MKFYFKKSLRKEKDGVVEYFTIIRNLIKILFFFINKWLKGVFAKNERGYRLNAIKKRF